MNWLPENPDRAAPMRRAIPAVHSAVLIALVVALSAALDVLDAAIAVEVCAILLALAIVFYAAMRAGLNLRWVDSSLITLQVGVLFALLAYLAYRSREFGAIIMLLYPVAMLPGVLRLDSRRLLWLVPWALITHAAAVFAAGSRTTIIGEALAVHLITLAAVLGLFAWSAGYIGRLRAQLTLSTHQLYAQIASSADKARRDELTGAYNRRYLFEVLAREMQRSERQGKPLCAACIDIDRFPETNAVFSEVSTAPLLARFSAAAHGVVRSVDIFGRTGATEFLLIMPDTELQKASIGAERFRAAIERIAIPELAGRARMTCAIGLAAHVKGQSLAALLEQAGAALNYARAAGGNRVLLSEAVTPAPAVV
jgi:diguanylate cyclase (GGDEF)-like protein